MQYLFTQERHLVNQVVTTLQFVPVPSHQGVTTLQKCSDCCVETQDGKEWNMHTRSFETPGDMPTIDPSHMNQGVYGCFEQMRRDPSRAK